MFSVLCPSFVICMSLKQSEGILRESLNDFKDSQKKLKSLLRLHENLVFCLQELGSFGALQVSWHCYRMLFLLVFLWKRIADRIWYSLRSILSVSNLVQLCTKSVTLWIGGSTIFGKHSYLWFIGDVLLVRKNAPNGFSWCSVQVVHTWCCRLYPWFAINVLVGSCVVLAIKGERSIIHVKSLLWWHVNRWQQSFRLLFLTWGSQNFTKQTCLYCDLSSCPSHPLTPNSKVQVYPRCCSHSMTLNPAED
jgi:hypothetical protein